MEQYKLALMMLKSAKNKVEEWHEYCPENVMEEIALNIGHQMDGFIEVLLIMTDMAETQLEKDALTAICEKIEEIKWNLWNKL